MRVSLFFLLVAPSGMVDLGPLGESTNENFSLNGGEILLFHSCFLRMIDKKKFYYFFPFFVVVFRIDLLCCCVGATGAN